MLKSLDGRNKFVGGHAELTKAIDELVVSVYVVICTGTYRCLKSCFSVGAASFSKEMPDILLFLYFTHSHASIECFAGFDLKVWGHTIEQLDQQESTNDFE